VIRADPEAIAEAAALLAQGALVAFPTETVYGLGADARQTAAVQKIYAVKGRPAHNPIIVHVLDAAAARRLTPAWDDRAERLAEAFWPGPLTLIVPLGPEISPAVAAGGTTVALRAPRHPVAQALLAAFGGPIAAPSANRSSAISPTEAAHVEVELGDRVPLILDGGPAEIGLESTVVDLDGRILRPGSVTPAQIAAVLGGAEVAADPAGPLRSPGLLRRHYAPRRRLEIGTPEAFEARGAEIRRVAALVWSAWEPPARWVARLPRDPAGYGRQLYATLRRADAQPVEAIWVERPPTGEPWLAVHDRLDRAATAA
jgi:L-threonylcarbamoyladenylate synthase